MFPEREETQNIALGTPLLVAGLLTARADKASAMVYCR